MARKWGRSHMAWVRSHKKRNPRRRRNPWPMAGVLANPRKRQGRKRSYRRNPARRYRRNPSMGSVLRIGGVGLPSMETMAFAGVGFLAPPFIENFVAPYLPSAVMSSTAGRYAFKVASVLGTSFLAKKVLGNNAARAVALGGSLYVIASAVMEFAPQLIAGQLSRPAAPQAPAQVAGYIRPAQVASYTRNLSGNTRFSQARAGDIAQRFKRF